MKELSPELGVTEPVSGDIVDYDAKCIQIIEITINFEQNDQIEKTQLYQPISVYRHLYMHVYFSSRYLIFLTK